MAKRSNRAGKEPAEDIKRRLVAAVQEVGLEKSEAMCRLLDDSRYVCVGASPPNWEHDMPMLSVDTWVSISGHHGGTVAVYCSGSPTNDVYGLRMIGRKDVPVTELVGELRDTLAERDMVLDKLAAGENPPFFVPTKWDVMRLPSVRIPRKDDFK